MPKVAPHCKHLLVTGKFCESPALSGDDYCYFHRSSRERHKRHLRHIRQQKPLQIGLLEDTESIQVAIGDVLNALLAKQIDHKTASLLLYGLQTASAAAKTCNFRVWESDESVVRYTEWEQHTLDEEVDEEIRQEQRLAERARRKAAKAAATATAQAAAFTSAAEPGEKDLEPPARPAPSTDLPEKKPATGVSQKEFWHVVGEMAKQNMNAAAQELEKHIFAADEADAHLALADEQEKSAKKSRAKA
jgi:hypothetical protein